MSDIVDEKLQRVSGDIPREDIAAFYRVLSTIVRGWRRCEAQAARRYPGGFAFAVQSRL